MNFYFSVEIMIKKNVVLLVFKKHNIFYIIFVTPYSIFLLKYPFGKHNKKKYISVL